MEERQRILELVKKGILSTEEALVLLENSATDKNKKQLQKAEEVVSEKQQIEDKKQTIFTEDVSEIEERQRKQDEERLEKILEDLANSANHLSAELDEVDAKIEASSQKIKDQKEQLSIYDTMESLETLDAEGQLKQTQLINEIQKQEKEQNELFTEKKRLEQELQELKKKEKEEKKAQGASWSDRFDIPDDWKENASDTMNQFGGKIEEASLQLGKMFKQTFKNVAEKVSDNVDWKEVNLKVPGMHSTKFNHSFVYEDAKASIIDVKVANGKIDFRPSEDETIKVDVAIKLYGKMDEATPLEAFLARSVVEVDDEKILFHVPNKRVVANIVFYLPNRIYDHVAIKTLNGDSTFQDIQAKDMYVKSTNGNLRFENTDATMVEIDSVNGNVVVTDGSIIDFLGETVNGNYQLKSNIQNLKLSLVNGTTKITPVATENTFKNIQVQTTNGTIKLAVPRTASLEGVVKASIGSVKSRLEDAETVREKNEKFSKVLEFRRIKDTQPTRIQLNTTTGSIYLKDTEE